jgi:hypothetical protein
MRLGRLSAGLLTSVIAFAVIAAPASARKEEVPKEFEASAAGKTAGVGTGIQEFKFKPYTIKCKTATSTGEVTEVKFKALVDKVKFEECSYGRKAEASVNPIEFEFLSNGHFNILNEVKFRLIASKCTINVEPQEVGEEESRHKDVTYANKGGELKIKTSVHLVEEGESGGLAYEFGRVCEKFEEPSGENGIYKGSLLDGLESGTLGIS